MTELTLQEVNKLRFDFTMQINLDGLSNVQITEDTLPAFYEKFLEIVRNNTYISVEKVVDQKRSSLPSDAKPRKELSTDEKKLLVKSVVYNAHKYGTLKYGPILYIGDQGDGKHIYVDLSFYIHTGAINIIPSIFARNISDLLREGNESNFTTFLKFKKIEPADEDSRSLCFPRSFVLKRGQERILLRRDIRILFDFLMDVDNRIKDLKVIKMQKVK
jgi:hypothetical protein